MRSAPSKQRTQSLSRPISLILISTVTIIIAFITFFHFFVRFFYNEKMDEDRKTHLTQMVHMARNAIEPVIDKIKTGGLSGQEGLQQARALVRNMVYEDRYGKNYIFMSTYDGIMLAQPFEPAMEMTSQWELKDSRGTFIFQALANAARRNPAGGFVSYYYYPPGSTEPDEKLSFVLGIPELNCYIGTGMYLKKVLREQHRILSQIRLLAVTLEILIFVPILIALRTIRTRNRDLIQSETKYREFVEQANSIMLRRTTDGTITFLNEFALRFFGYREDEIMGKNVIGTIVPPQDTSGRDLAEMINSISTEPDKFKNNENENICRDGKRVWISWTNQPIIDTKGHIVEILSVGNDITERKQAEIKLNVLNEQLSGAKQQIEAQMNQLLANEQFLRESEERFRALAETTPDAIITSDADLHIIYWNDGARNIFGYEPSEVLGRTVEFLIPEQGLTTHSQSIQGLHETGYSPNMGMTWQSAALRKGGAQFPIEISISTWRAGEKQFYSTIIRDITARKQAEHELQLEKKRLQDIIQFFPDATFVVDAAGKVIAWNRALEHMTGISQHDIIGQADYAYAVPFYGTKRPLLIDLALAHIDDIQDQYDFIKHDGAIIYAETFVPALYEGKGAYLWVTASPLFDEQGGIWGAIESIRDISDRKQTEKTLQEREQQYRAIFESTTNGLFILDLTGKIVEANPPACQIHGYTYDELIGMHGKNIVHPEYHYAFDNFMEQLRTKGEYYTEAVDIRKDKSTFPIQVHGNVFNFKSKPHYLAVINDITKNKKAEEERARLTAAIEQAHEYIQIMDAGGTILYMNAAVQNELGYTKDEVVGINPFKVKSKMHEDNFYTHIWETISAGNIWSGHMRNRKKDGGVVDLEITISPMRNETGKITNYVSISRNITKELLMKEQLRQAQKMEAIGTLAGGIAHDFNNILGAIIGYTEMALFDTPQDGMMKHNLEQVLKSADRAKNLVKQILAFSRKNSQERKPVQADLIVTETLKLLRASLPTTIDIQQHISSHACMIMADPTQIHQIIMNLCTNAAHAMQEKGGVLSVDLVSCILNEEDVASYQELKPGGYVKLTVRDTGAGIAPTILDRIFEPFFTTKEVDKGTGMGLAVVHGIIKSHGGAITVTSKPGEGAAFTVLLPQLQDAVREAKKIDKPLPTGTETILFVDDEAFLSEIMQEILVKLGYRVVNKQSSQDAFETFMNAPHAFDLVITDQTMPHMTGDSLAKKLMDIRPDVPVILCTGYSERISEEKAKALGIKAFLMKPIGRQELAETVRAVLDSRSA